MPSGVGGHTQMVERSVIAVLSWDKTSEFWRFVVARRAMPGSIRHIAVGILRIHACDPTHCPKKSRRDASRVAVDDD